jgi:hypothetical protein
VLSRTSKSLLGTSIKKEVSIYQNHMINKGMSDKILEAEIEILKQVPHDKL